MLTLFRCPFHPRVTAVARKRPRPFCQKFRWQVTTQMHTPLSQRSRSELTMPLSRHSVGTYQETSSHATRQGTLGHSRLGSQSLIFTRIQSQFCVFSQNTHTNTPHTHTYTNASKHTYTLTHTNAHAYTYTHRHAHHTYTHTHTHTHPSSTSQPLRFPFQVSPIGQFKSKVFVVIVLSISQSRNVTKVRNFTLVHF